MTGLQHFNKEQKSNPQSHVESPFPYSLGIISGSRRRKVRIISGPGSFRGRFGDRFRVGDHFGVGIISGAVQAFVQLHWLLSLVAIVGMIVYTTKETVGDIIRFSEIGDFHLSAEFFTCNSKLHDYTAEQSTARKPFIYLTETEQCLLQNLVSSSQIGDPETCNYDVIVLSFLAKRQDNKQPHILTHHVFV